MLSLNKGTSNENILNIYNKLKQNICMALVFTSWSKLWKKKNERRKENAKFTNVLWSEQYSIWIISSNFQRELEGYMFPVYSTPFCPRNESEWNKKSSALNCSEKRGYTCLPNQQLTELLEFCYTEPRIWVEAGKQ